MLNGVIHSEWSPKPSYQHPDLLPRTLLLQLPHVASVEAKRNRLRSLFSFETEMRPRQTYVW
jgi:hypothetical protein